MACPQVALKCLDNCLFFGRACQVPFGERAALFSVIACMKLSLSAAVPPKHPSQMPDIEEPNLSAAPDDSLAEREGIWPEMHSRLLKGWRGWQSFRPSNGGGAQHADCALCGSLRAATASRCGSLCGACHEHLPRLGSDACPTCALPGTQGLQCGACIQKPPPFDAAVAALRYGFPVPQMIAQLKYAARLPWADWAALELSEAVLASKAQKRVDVLVAVPLARKRLAERGFNQAELLAEALARRCGIAHRRGALQRVRETAPQVGQDREARMKNLRDVFQAPADLAGLRVAVVDDVMTTGATLESIARALRKSGVARVEAWVVARAEGHDV